MLKLLNHGTGPQKEQKLGSLFLVTIQVILIFRMVLDTLAMVFLLAMWVEKS